MPDDTRKQLHNRPGIRTAPLRTAALSMALLVFACSAPPRVVTIHLADLEAGRDAEWTCIGRFVVGDRETLETISRPICDNLRLVQVRSDADWRRLVEAIPALGNRKWDGRPVFGVCSEFGTPLNGVWPLMVTGLRRHDGAGWLSTELAVGTFLPDRMLLAELVACEGVSAVLVVEVNGVRYYPES